MTWTEGLVCPQTGSLHNHLHSQRAVVRHAPESDMWKRLVLQLDNMCVLFPNHRLANAHQDHTADLMALVPNSGIVVIRVKGSHV